MAVSCFSSGVDERLSVLAQRKNILLVHIIETELEPHICEFGREDIALLESGAMFQVGIVLHQGTLIRVTETSVLTVLLDSSLKRTTCLPKADLTTLSGDAVHSWCIQL
jgi:hypothetical protein